MQQQMMRPKEPQEELTERRTPLSTVECERNRALGEPTELKRRMDRSDDDATSGELKNPEMGSVKESLLKANKELRNKDKMIESLRSEVCKMKWLGLKLEQKNATIELMTNEQNSLKASMAVTEGLLSDTQAKLEKSKLEVAALNEKMRELEEEYRQKYEAAKEVIDRLGHELQAERENSSDANNRDESASLETQGLLDDIEVLKNELKQAMEAENNSKKAMDDFALVLKEVTAGLKHTKEKLRATEEQLQVVTEEAANLKKMLQSTEQTSEALIKELKTDRDRLKNTVQRLRLEAEESLLAWNGKEIEFVRCIKKAENEKGALVQENNELKESIRETEETSFKLKDEIKKLRDVLKQAVTEANMAKEAANLARADNAYLKDFLEEKDRALVHLAQENECLRMNEADANENTKELRHLIKMGLKKEISPRSEKESKQQRRAAKRESIDSSDRELKEGKKLSSTFNVDPNQLQPGTPKSAKDIEDEEPENDDDLRGSIFDIMESPMEEGEATQHHRRTCSGISDDGNNIDDAEQFNDMDLDRSFQGKRKALLKRFGDLLRRKKFMPTQASIMKDLPQPHKEITV